MRTSRFVSKSPDKAFLVKRTQKYERGDTDDKESRSGEHALAAATVMKSANELPNRQLAISRGGLPWMSITLC